MKPYYAIKVGDSESVVSVVTPEYRELLLASEPPEFYKSFRFVPFDSAMTYTELNRSLPFRIHADSQLTFLDPSALTPVELRHLEAHRHILAIYDRLGLPPLPPWKQDGLDPYDASELSAAVLELSPQL